MGLRLECNQLKVGIIKNNLLKIDLIEEMLNHQGMLYDVCDENNIQNYPCVISIDNQNIRHENLILIDSKLLYMFFNAFSGSSKYDEDYMVNALLTEYEIQLTEKIRECFHRQNLPFVRKWFWPDFKMACCVITHDIDHIDRVPSKKRSKIECAKYVFSHLLLKPYGDNIKTILKHENKKSIKSTFYFLSKYPYEKLFMPLPEYIYDKHLINLLNIVKNGECEIGLHGFPETASDPKLLAEGKNKLEIHANIEITGQRQHTLKFTVPETWAFLESNGFKCDTTFSCNTKFGFRIGICYPYHPFDKNNRKKFKILEIPMSYMDSIGYQYRNYAECHHISIINKLMNTVERYNGVLVLNFHNAYVNKKLYPEIYNAFLKSLNIVSQKKYWIATTRDCAEWWLKRENAKVDIFFKNEIIIGKSTIPIPISIEYPDKTENVHVNTNFEISR